MLPGRVIDTGDERRLGTDQVAEFVGDRAEDLGRPRSAGDQRGDAPQRGLLIGQLAQPGLVGWIMAGLWIGGMAHVGAGVWRVHNADGSPTPGGPTTMRSAA